jgi:hypothetical protein
LTGDEVKKQEFDEALDGDEGLKGNREIKRK